MQVTFFFIKKIHVSQHQAYSAVYRSAAFSHLYPCHKTHFCGLNFLLLSFSTGQAKTVYRTDAKTQRIILYVNLKLLNTNLFCNLVFPDVFYFVLLLLVVNIAVDYEVATILLRIITCSILLHFRQAQLL